MNNLDRQYLDLLNDIVDSGTIKEDRTGTGTMSVFGRTIRHKMSEGFPLLTTKKVHFKSVATELFWFLQGRTDLRWLLEHNNHIWVGDAYRSYLNEVQKYKDENIDLNKDGSPLSREQFIDKIKTDDDFSEKWGYLGPIYGSQWRHWTISPETGGGYIDQIEALIENLKENPDSRRLMVNAWNVADIEDMILPPCHYGFQCYTRKLTDSERFNWYANKTGSFIHHDHIEQEMNEENVPTRALSLKWNQRSVDTPLGLPFNIASYGLLLTMLALEVNMIADELIADLGDTHIYLNQLDGVEEQLERDSFDLPELFITKGLSIFDAEYKDLQLVDYQSHPPIKFPLSN